MKTFTRLILFSYLLIIFSACNSNKSFPEEKEWSLEIIKSGCLDVCDSYSIIIHSNSKYEYKGMFKVKVLGKKSGSLSENDMILVKKYIKAIEWDNLKSIYGSEGSGPQRKEINYNINQTTKKTVYFSLETQEIRDLENTIDKIINHDKF